MERDIYFEIESIIDETGSVYIYGTNDGQKIFEDIYNSQSEVYSCMKIDGKKFIDECNKLTDKEIRNKYFSEVFVYFIFNVDSIFDDKKALDYLFDLFEDEEKSFVMLANNSFSDYNEDIRAGLSGFDEICID